MGRVHAGVGDPSGGAVGLARNVCVAMGSWLASVGEPPETPVAVLRQALEDEEPLVREHAAWALKQCQPARPR